MMQQMLIGMGGGAADSTTGIEFQCAGYTYFIFTSPGSFELGSDKPGASAIIGGGGGGGGGGIYHGAGGGAGGVAYTPSVNIAAGTYTVTIGTGGAGGPGSYGNKGNSTSVSGPIGSACAEGGGYGGGYLQRGGPGGSGGGSGRESPCPAGGVGCQQPQPCWSMTGYGSPGTAQCPPGGYGSGGGGGAGGTAPYPGSPGVGGAGGPSQSFGCEFGHTILGPSINPVNPGWSNAVAYYGCYAGGGGGGSYLGSGGAGGGGGGGPAGTAPRDGIDGTGGGGAMNPSHSPGAGGSGGDGIAIFRWAS